MIVVKLMGGIVSPVRQIESGFLINEWKNVMDAHRTHLLGDGSFGHPGQLLKWIDLRVSPILNTLFEQCVIKNLRDCTEIDGWDSFFSLPD